MGQEIVQSQRPQSASVFGIVSGLVELGYEEMLGGNCSLSGLIAGSLSLAAAEDPALIRFCERYEEVKDQEELADYVTSSQSIGDFIEECQGRQDL